MKFTSLLFPRGNQAVSNIVAKPKMREKLMQRPPFRFVKDIICNVSKVFVCVCVWVGDQLALFRSVAVILQCVISFTCAQCFRWIPNTRKLNIWTICSQLTIFRAARRSPPKWVFVRPGRFKKTMLLGCCCRLPRPHLAHHCAFASTCIFEGKQANISAAGHGCCERRTKYEHAYAT